MHCIYVQNSEINLSTQIATILTQTFKNHSYKLLISNTLLIDISDQNRQKELLKYHHEKTCHRGINEVGTYGS